MNTEISAGGLIVCKDRAIYRMLIMKDLNNTWTFPKGKVEQGEHFRVTATREIQEELGIADLTYISELTPITYWYFRKKSIKKIVHYFLFQSANLQNPIVQKEEGINDAIWVTLDEAEHIIGYPETNIPLIQEVRQILKHNVE